MTQSYRSPHKIKGPTGYERGGPQNFTVNPPPSPRPPEACGVEWLMAHVVDVIAAGPRYGDTLSPVWAQMVRLYAQYLGVIPTRAARRDDRSPRRQALEKDLRALIPAIADLIEAHEAGEEAAEEEADEELGEAEEAAPPSTAENETPDPADLAVAEAFELEPITRLNDDGVMRDALGFRPTLDSLNRVLQLALDASMRRARLLRGPLAEISPKTEEHIARINQRWLKWLAKGSDPEGKDSSVPKPDQPETTLPEDYFFPFPRASPN